MEWPLKLPAIPLSEVPTWLLYYQAACPTPSDPTIVWGTDVPVEALHNELRLLNARSDVLVSPAHVLIWAVGQCLARHPQFNRRLLRRRLYEFRQVNVLVPIQVGRRGPEVCLLVDVDRKPLTQLASELWEHSRQLQKGNSEIIRDERLFRLLPRPLRNVLFRAMLAGNHLLNWPAALWGHRTLRAGTLINFLGHRGAPPMRTFKPSRFPTDVTTMNVTLGPSETDPHGSAVAPLIVRVDHRVVDALQLGRFLGDLRQLLMDFRAAEHLPPVALPGAA